MEGLVEKARQVNSIDTALPKADFLLSVRDKVVLDGVY